jgi:hypothetical protein
MKVEVRASTPADVAGIAALFAECGLRTNVDRQYLAWKYWQPRADWEGPRSFLIASSAQLIAHSAILPGSCAWGGRRLATFHMIDWVARLGSGAGVMLLKHLSRMTQALLAIGGGPETRRIIPHIGFRPVGTVTAHARPLYPLRILGGGVAWKRPSRLLRAAWRRSPVGAPDPDWQARRLAADELGQIRAVLPRPTHGMAVTERTVGLFRHMLNCPTAAMQLYAVEKAGRVRGYFLLASVPGQVRIADCWMDSEESSDWRALLLCAVDQAKHDPQAAEVVSYASDALLAAALRACGFHARFQIPVQLLPARGEPMPEGTWRVQMLDSDDAFLYDGWEYWG